MDADTQKKLRVPFQPDQIGKLPRVTCGNCSRDKQRKHCDRHQRTQCQVCGNYITTAHMHLDYVGHAAITDRLLAVDPGWTWEPLAIGPDGLPVRDREGGLWIRLTVAGVTRLGYGDADGKAGPSAVKEAIGDALRNGAMRFGVALDLWHKDGELHQDDEQPATPQNGEQQRQGQRSQQSRNGAQNGHQGNGNGQRTNRPLADEPAATGADKARAALRTKVEEEGWDGKAVAEEFSRRYEGASLKEETNAPRIEAFTKLLDDMPAEHLRAAATNGAAQ